ncbi:MAG: hypothetical protein LBL60_01360 [Mycoplasmataceae bacterium]|jgi:hypothetical protein|nr:hypothetical protein [Mycoplasmataceae bacterium]
MKKTKQEKRIGLTREQLKREIEHFKTLLSVKYGKPSPEQEKYLKGQVEHLTRFYDNFDKLDINKDGILQEGEQK